MASRKFMDCKEPTESHEQPTEYRTVKSFKELPSLLQLESGLLAVDETLKGLIEEFEPGVHQFWPLKITMPRGKEYPVAYFGMIVLQERDSLIPEDSELGRYFPEGNWYHGRGSIKRDYGEICLSRAAIGRAHFWRERRLRNPDLLLSNALQTAIAGRGLKIWRHYQVREI